MGRPRKALTAVAELKKGSGGSERAERRPAKELALLRIEKLVGNSDRWFTKFVGLGEDVDLRVLNARQDIAHLAEDILALPDDVVQKRPRGKKTEVGKMYEIKEKYRAIYAACAGGLENASCAIVDGIIDERFVTVIFPETDRAVAIQRGHLGQEITE